MKKDFNRRIKKHPYSESWYNSYGGFNDSLVENGVIDYEGLSDSNKVLLCVYAWNKTDRAIGPSKISNLLKFSLDKTKFYLRKLKEKGNVQLVPTMSEETGLLTGSGYQALLNQ